MPRFLKDANDALSELRQAIFSSVRACLVPGQDAAWLVAVSIVGLATRAYFLAQPMRYDESYTFLDFVNTSFANTFNYSVPNNHVLHSLLVRLSTTILGTHPPSIRAPAFLAGAALAPLIFWVCRKMTPGRSGILAATAMATMPYMVLYSTMARGYSLVVLLALVLVGLVLHVVEKPSWPGSALISLTAALGMATIPLMLFAVAGVYIWAACLLLLKKHPARAILGDFIVPCAILTPVLTFIMYVPSILVTGGIRALAANQFVRPSEWTAFLTQAGPHLASILADFSRDVPKPWLLLFAVFLAIGSVGAWRRHNWPVLLLLPLTLLGALVVLAANHRIPPVRTWICFIPFALVATDAGAAYAAEKLPPRLKRYLAPGLVGAGLLFAFSLMRRDTILHYPDTGHFPEAAQVVRKLDGIMRGNDHVDLRIPADRPTFFYAWYYGVPSAPPLLNPGSNRTFFVVHKRYYTIGDMTSGPVVKVFERGHAVIYEAVQPDSGPN